MHDENGVFDFDEEDYPHVPMADLPKGGIEALITAAEHGHEDAISIFGDPHARADYAEAIELWVDAIQTVANGSTDPATIADLSIFAGISLGLIKYNGIDDSWDWIVNN